MLLQKFQRLGGAMFTPVLLLAPAGIIIGITTLLLSPTIMGSWVVEQESFWFIFWSTLNTGAWTVFKQMPLVFSLAMPVALAKKQKARCCLEALVLFLVFNYFISNILEYWGEFFNVEYSLDPSEGSKMTVVASIPTLNMGIFGSLVISGIVVWLHNKFFDAKLPALLSVFNGSVAVFTIGFFVMIPCAVAACIVWPIVQDGILYLSKWLSNAGELGVFIFTFLEKALLPFGLHHLIYFPIQYDNILCDGGTYAQWLRDLPDIAANTGTLREAAPYGGFMLTALSSIFGMIGIGAAFYATAKKEKRKKLLVLIVPLVLTACVCAITEPIEYTFLFVAPLLFYVHAFLAACLATTVYALGISGAFTGNLFERIAINYVPCANNHWLEYVIMIAVGIGFMVIYFLVFRALILKFKYKTPGREDDGEEIEFKSKQDYRDKKDGKLDAKGDKDSNGVSEVDGGGTKMPASDDPLEVKILAGLGGKDNIEDVTNCATRLRVNVKDSSLLQDDKYFKSIGTHGASIMGKSVQVIIGLNVPSVREDFEQLL